MIFLKEYFKEITLSQTFILKDMAPFNDQENIPNNDLPDEVEIQFSYDIHFSVDGVIEEEEFMDAVCDVIGPSDETVETPYGETINFYTANAPENFDKENGVFNFYVHFQIKTEWFVDTDRNNFVQFLHSIKDIAIKHPYSNSFMLGDATITITDITLDNAIFPYKEGEYFGVEIDSETF